MKRFVALLLCFCCTLLCVNIPSISAPVKAEQAIDLSRDINGDNLVDLLDTTVLCRYIAGWPGLTYLEQNLDINGDSAVDLLDITHLSRLIAGWYIDDFTVNNPNYTWPNLSPVMAEAGTTFLTADKAPTASGPLSKFLLTTSNNPSLPFNIACHISGTAITAMIPAGIKLNAMKVDITFTGQKLLQGSTQVYSNLTAFDFTKPVTLTLVGTNGSSTNYTVSVMTLHTGLPSFSVATDDYMAINSKYTDFACSVYAGGGNPATCSYANKETVTDTGTVSGRGNSSWSFPKKSYTLKFDSKHSLFNMPSNKEWVLAANYADRTLLRNALAFQLAGSFGVDPVMEFRFVDLWVNGVYNGNYLLIEKIEIGKDRINITDFNPALPPDQVGYVIETNGHDNITPRPSYWQSYGPLATYDTQSGDIFFKSLLYTSIFVIKKPSDTKLNTLPLTEATPYIAYIYDYMNKLEAALKTRKYSEASKYLDMDAMAKWYLVEETAMSRDAKLFCSCFMYKDVGGTMKMGPVWDFDLSFGNGEFVENPKTNYLDGSTWFVDLLAMPEFKALVKQIWNQNNAKAQSDSASFIGETQTMINASQQLNFEKWSFSEFNTFFSPTSVNLVTPLVLDLSTYQEQSDYMTTFLSDRFTFLNTKISGW